jgi:hypothetical protein
MSDSNRTTLKGDVEGKEGLDCVIVAAENPLEVTDDETIRAVIQAFIDTLNDQRGQ